jgi:mRNA interferase RelE/StbE
MYKIVWKERVLDDFHDLSPVMVFQIKKKIEEYLLQAPKELGKPLKGRYKGLYRYRFGNYRVIYSIATDEMLVTVVKVGHRKEIYDG